MLEQTETGQMNQSEATGIAPVGRLWWVVLLAIVVATTANVIFYFILTRLLGIGRNGTRDIIQIPNITGRPSRDSGTRLPLI